MVEITFPSGKKIWFKDLETYNDYVETLEKSQRDCEKRIWYGEDYKSEQEDKDEKNRRE